MLAQAHFKRLVLSWFLIFGSAATAALAPAPALAVSLPDCLAQGEVLPVNNSQIIQWKKEAKDQFKARGHVTGVIARIFRDQTEHKHFELKIGDAASDTLEVIYSEIFGAMDGLRVGMEVEVCGDYITASQGSARPSPSGALIHWVHKSDDLLNHASGYVAINGVLYGQDLERWLRENANKKKYPKSK